MIQEMVRFTDDPEVRHRIVFLPNYDIQMARTLMPGCDVWLNNPLRPLEACGTSGMKVAMNGGAEPVRAGRLVGRDVRRRERLGHPDRLLRGLLRGAGRHRGRGPVRPAGEPVRAPVLRCRALRPGRCGRTVRGSKDGIPHQWLAMVKHTMATLGPAMSADRMVQDYVNELYRPAAAAGRTMDANDYARGRELAAWKTKIRTGFGRGRGTRGLARSERGTADRGRDAGVRVRQPG